MQSAASLRGVDTGLVKVATFSSVSAQWLPSILKSFGEIYPNIEFDVITSDFYEQVEEWILKGTVDCGFRAALRETPPYLLPCHRTCSRSSCLRPSSGRQRPFPHGGAGHGALHPVGGGRGLRDTRRLR